MTIPQIVIPGDEPWKAEMLRNRERELGYLNTRYASSRAEVVVLYGRRRVGKTTLAYHWAQDKPHLFFFATQDDNATLLRRFSQLTRQVSGESPDPAFTFPDWETALRALASLARERRFVVVIDEFPRLVAAHPPIASYLQLAWDMDLQYTQVFLILTGSLLSVMRQQVLDPDAPLYLRHTWPFELKPLTVADLSAFFPAYSPDALVETYAVLGGMPYYLISVNSAVDLLTNVRQAILEPTGSLFNEIPLQLHLEMRGIDLPLYMRVLQAIAQGAHSRSEITQAAALEGKNLSHYLLTLQEMGLVTVQQPLERSRARRRWARYHLQDPFLRFWQRFVGPRQAELEIGHGQEALWHEIRHQLPHVVAPMWERIARWHLLQSGGQGGLPPVAEVGSWWSGQAQIDAVGVDRHSRSVVFGEARWRQEPVTGRNLERLVERGQKWLRGSDAHWDVHYVVYARNLAAGLQILAEGERKVHLFTPADILASRTE
ncbi:MAG: ATP-binding protein [Anaerolineae bacterium]|nr:MAG: ATP-binding protein [Anaerolineae bacterium]